MTEVLLNLLRLMRNLCRNARLAAASQSEAQKDGAFTASEARPSVLVRRTSRFILPTPMTSSDSFTAAMTHQPGQVKIGASPLAMLPAAPVSARSTADAALLPSTSALADVRLPGTSLTGNVQETYGIRLSLWIVFSCRKWHRMPRVFRRLKNNGTSHYEAAYSHGHASDSEPRALPSTNGVWLYLAEQHLAGEVR